MKNYFRKCPKCKKELGYSLKRSRDDAEKSKTLCISCAKDNDLKNERNCPGCNKILIYTKVILNYAKV